LPDFDLHRPANEYRLKSRSALAAGVRQTRRFFKEGPHVLRSNIGKIAMMQRILTSILVPFFGSLLLCDAALSQTGGPTPSPAGAAEYFIGLKDGDTLPTKATLHFGLRAMGVAPAGSDRANSGHHHLIVDAPTPALNTEIPNDFQHLHFGAGQTETEISLTPGEHTLQLVFGDKNHVPHSPPVLSERIKVKVADAAPPPAPAAAAGGRKPSPKDAKVYFIYPTDGAYISPNPVIRFGLLNMGVAPAGFDKPNTGHHHLLVDAELPALDQPIPNDFNHLHFGAGQTEAKITLPLGQHKLRLLFADSVHVAHNPPVYSDVINVTVTESGRPPKKRARRHRSWRHYRY
jgi:hypothetical protein